MANDVEKQPKKQLGGATGKGFMPGKSGNPKGRPKKEFCLTDLLRDKAMAHKEELTDILLEMARKKDRFALKYLYDRIDGLPKATHEIEGHIEGTINIIRSDD